MDRMSVAKRVKELFEEICRIPRPSFHEEKIADFVCEFAQKHGCEVYRDSAHNVLVNVKATKGCENVAPILLQGHTDMVCEKNEGVEHDFLTDGIKLCEKDGWLRAQGTTLGADDGVAVAIMLFVIEGGVEYHGDIQCLFTTAEEVGLDGVKCFDFSRVYCKKMINMDGESEGSVIVGCAGGLRSDITFTPDYIKAEGEGLTIKVSGLCGGHSGENISSGRANANLILGEMLSALLCCGELSLLNIGGGSKDNAIPREAFATVAVKDAKAAEEVVMALAKEIDNTLSSDDEAFSVSCDAVELCGKEIVHSIVGAEPFGPKISLDALIIAPCTGNTLAKMANGITDTAVCMASKAHLRSNRPLILALASNDALSANLRNIATLLSRKHVYFVPMIQDDPQKKPHSLVANFDRVVETVNRALMGTQSRKVFE